MYKGSAVQQIVDEVVEQMIVFVLWISAKRIAAFQIVVLSMW